MLLRVDFDSGITRTDLFRDCPAWGTKIVLLDRIVWFEPPPGVKQAGPSENHAWYVWDWGRPPGTSITYAAKPLRTRKRQMAIHRAVENNSA